MLLIFIVFLFWLDILAKYAAVKFVCQSWLRMFAGCLCSLVGCADQAGWLQWLAILHSDLVFYALWLC
jgi:hypothetical protein